MLSNSSTVTESTGLAVPTSEMNAALSGTLANKIQELKDGKLLNYEVGYPVAISENVSNEAINYQRFGGICTVSFLGVITMTGTMQTIKIAEGLPPCASNANPYPYGIFQFQNSGLAYAARVDSSGGLYIRSDANPQTGWYRGSITYPCKV